MATSLRRTVKRIHVTLVVCKENLWLGMALIGIASYYDDWLFSKRQALFLMRSRQLPSGEETLRDVFETASPLLKLDSLM